MKSELDSDPTYEAWKPNPEGLYGDFIFNSDPTYEAWKRTLVTNCSLACSYSDPTYEAWKLQSVYHGLQPVSTFRSYLRGMETWDPNHLHSQQ